MTKCLYLNVPAIYIQACSVFITSVAKDGDKIGIVVFSSSATIKMRVTVVNSNTRPLLLSNIPTVASGGTNIAAGNIILAGRYDWKMLKPSH